MTEKKAGIGFPSLEGKLEIESAFISSNEKFHKWGRDLFEYYWVRAKSSTVLQ